MINFLNKKNKEPKNFKEILSCFKALENNFKKISQELEALKEENKFSIQKVGIVRFSPFNKGGGDQSFSIALLNSADTGIVITNLFNGEESRIYGKSIKDGKSSYCLTKEEEEAIIEAKKYKDSLK
ncbi:MAG: DUF4446 family protein [Candidatus Nealsonbacteria bacterium]|nr:DUF4446 family protein [Candidatus Nealsonbacteria bacterium]